MVLLSSLLNGSEFLEMSQLFQRYRCSTTRIFLGIAAVSLVDFYAVIDVEPLGRNSGSADKLYLLGFTIIKRGGALQGVKVVFIKAALSDGWGGGFRFRYSAVHTHEIH